MECAGVGYFLVVPDFNCAAASAHPWQDGKFVFVVFAGESFFGHRVGRYNVSAAGYVIFVKAGCFVEFVFVFVQCSTGQTGNYHDQYDVPRRV